MSFTAIVTTGNGQQGTDFHIEMTGHKFFGNVVPGGTQMFEKPVGETSFSFTDVNFGVFIAGDAINDVGRCARELVSNRVIRLVRNVGRGVDAGANVAT